MEKKVIIYTDGGCIGNPGPGGWGAILQYGDHQREISGKFRNTTNNRMELRAAIEALELLKRPSLVEIYTDSAYVRNGITTWIHSWQKNNWRTAGKKPVKNKDLWKRLLVAIERHKKAGEVSWYWVKGHSGNPLNEKVDDLANSAARSVTESDPQDIEKTQEENQTSLFDI